MTKTLYINQTLDECRAALVENGKIVDFFMERGGECPQSTVRVGNIYKGRVLKVLPGIGAAFVDIGQEKAAFLYLNRPGFMSGKLLKDERRSGTVSDDFATLEEGRDSTPSHQLREGEQIWVQVFREPIGMKGAKVTRNISLSGRYIVYIPLGEDIGISRRIETVEERQRLESVLKSFCPPEVGVIARTYSEGKPTSVLKAEFDYLELQWKKIQHRYRKISAPGVCYEELPFVQQILRDVVDNHLDSIYVDSPEQQATVERYVGTFLPELAGKCKFYRESTPLFKKFGIEEAVAQSYSNKLYLRSGGVINIEQTEALVVIDVNTAKFVGKNNFDQTILKTNLEAVEKIAQQLRLRNCGGIIVVDFIDMVNSEHREKVFQALLVEVKKDRVKYSIMPISGLGLVEMTRKQSKETFGRIVCRPCPYCRGSGRVKSADSVCYELLRDLFGDLKKRPQGTAGVSIHAHPDVIHRICRRQAGSLIDNLEESWGRSFELQADEHYHMEQYDIFFTQ